MAEGVKRWITRNSLFKNKHSLKKMMIIKSRVPREEKKKEEEGAEKILFLTTSILFVRSRNFWSCEEIFQIILLERKNVGKKYIYKTKYEKKLSYYIQEPELLRKILKKILEKEYNLQRFTPHSSKISKKRKKKNPACSRPFILLLQLSNQRNILD